ncbi:helix-turn-helix domain-containing protein [Longibacter salinarum]|uniref:helix-turn-helix domain-containing protein n=1 Tax=Longibacter salinarum TaxID=1850348 RepID=UPI0015CF2BF9
MPVEILSNAGYLYGKLQGSEGERKFNVRTASLDGNSVQTLTPLILEPQLSIDEIGSPDLMIVSAGGADLELECKRNARLFPVLNRAYENGTAIGGVCAGAALLAEAGLLDGRPATTHWAIVDACRKRYPEVDWQPERSVTESDNILCSGGVFTGVDLSLYLVEKHCGHRVAAETARALLLQTPRIWQAGYTAEAPEITHEDAQIREAQEKLFKDFSESISVKALAASVGMSSRTFSRRFKASTGETPIQYLQRVRVNAARHLLENDLKTIQEVCWAVGYEDVGHFRKLFKRYTGMPPQTYRNRFSRTSSETVSIEGRTPHQ